MMKTQNAMTVHGRLSRLLRGLVTVAGVGVGAASLLGFLGPFHWLLDLFSHFRVQYFCGLVVVALCHLIPGMRRSAAIFGVLAAVNLAVILPLYFDRSPVPVSAGRSIRAMLMNVNTQLGNPASVANALRQSNPDIVVLEEVNTRWLNDLAPVLAVYQYSKQEPRADNFGIALYSKFPIAQSRVEFIGDAGVPSIMAEIETPQGPCTVLATHPLPPVGREYSRLRNSQLAQLPRWVHRASSPLILLGDLNTTPWSSHFQQLLNDSGLRDSLQGRGVRPTWPTRNPLLLIPIDHCLYSTGIGIVERQTGPHVGSDHFPVIVDFVIGPERVITEHPSAAENEQVTFYPSYGYQEGDAWVIPLRLWVHERRSMLEMGISQLAKNMGDLEPAEMDNFRARIRDFVEDSESREAVTFQFDNDPAHHEYGCPADFPKTGLNGLVENGVIRIPLTAAQELLRRQGSRNGWLTYHATSKGHAGTGRVQLIEPTGLSVISDIDDTIKITEIYAGKKTVVRNTFFRGFTAVPHMAEMYQGWKGAAFHYVSGGPWQLYGPLSQFLISEQGGFPEGTFHMRQVRKNPLSANTWEDLGELVTNDNATFDHKVAQIREIMCRFPLRKFVLIGDSGEMDPEVYRKIQQAFPDQVQEIRIRDVVHDRVKKPGRLEGMTVIEAVTDY